MFEADTNIVGVKLLIGNELVEAGISLEEGKIRKIGKEPNLPKADQIHDARGLVASPGLIDAHVHLRDLQLSYKEDFLTGTCAAAAGGFTTVLDMPNNMPPTDSAANLRLRRDAAISKIVVNVGFHGALLSDQEETQRMRSMGVCSFKLYLNDLKPSMNIDDDSVILNALSTCALINAPVTVHAEDRISIERRLKEFEGEPLGFDGYSHIHTPGVESKAVNRILELGARSGASLHICHVSSGSSLRTIKDAKGHGVKVTCEVTPHHLLLSKKSMEERGGWALADPPLRDAREVRDLWRGLPILDFMIIASDHAPHSLTEKSSKDVRELRPGIPGLETTAPLLLDQVSKGQLPLPKLFELLAERPARIFGLKNKGLLAEGGDADITILDLNAEHIINPEKFHSKARYSPFAGRRCRGKISKVFVGGQVIFDEGEIVVPPGTGRIIEGGPG
jgi:dihydroorotase